MSLCFKTQIFYLNLLHLSPKSLSCQKVNDHGRRGKVIESFFNSELFALTVPFHSPTMDNKCNINLNISCFPNRKMPYTIIKGHIKERGASQKTCLTVIENITKPQTLKPRKQNSSKERNPDTVTEVSPDQKPRFAFLPSWLGWEV